MGCHTWVYKKEEALRQEEKQKYIDEKISELENWWGFKFPFENIVGKVESWFKEQPELFERKKISPSVYARIMVDKYTEDLKELKEVGWEKYLELEKNSEKTYIINEILFINIDFDYPFRVFGYPEETFTREYDLLQWLKKLPQYQLEYYNDRDEEIIGYTEELEKRIKEYYKLHGENNLFFEFD